MLIDQLLELQATDSAADRLRHRASTLPELGVATHARQALLTWESTRTAMRARLDELSAQIESAEEASAEIDRHRRRLEAQLRTVIAPREAEALQHEIATLAERRSESDDRELAALEEQAELDDALVAHVAYEWSLREALQAAEAALGAVQGDLDRELDELAAGREQIRAGLDTISLARYDRLRDHHGVAVARLVGHRCDGCHLDLAAAEVDAVMAVPADELAACPQCDRILAR